MDHVGREEAKRRKHAVEGWYSGASYIEPEFCAERLKEYERYYAIIREWCGTEATKAFDERLALQNEVMRLRSIIEDIAHDYRIAGRPRRASNLLKKLHNHVT